MASFGRFPKALVGYAPLFKFSDGLSMVMREISEELRLQQVVFDLETLSFEKKIVLNNTEILSEKSDLVLAACVMFGLLPNHGFYSSDYLSRGVYIPFFGEVITLSEVSNHHEFHLEGIENDDERDICEVLCDVFSETASMPFLHICATIFLSRQTLFGLLMNKVVTKINLKTWKLLCDAEVLLFSKCIDIFLNDHVLNLVKENNLIELQDIKLMLQSQYYNSIFFSNLKLNVSASIARLESVRVQEAEAGKESHVEKYSNVITQLKLRLSETARDNMSDEERRKDEELKIYFTKVGNKLDEFLDNFKCLRREYSIPRKKIDHETYESIKLRLEELDVGMLKARMEKLKAEKKEKMLQLAQLRSRLSALENQEAINRDHDQKTQNVQKNDSHSALQEALTKQAKDFLEKISSFEKKLKKERDEGNQSLQREVQHLKQENSSLRRELEVVTNFNSILLNKNGSATKQYKDISTTASSETISPEPTMSPKKLQLQLDIEEVDDDEIEVLLKDETNHKSIISISTDGINNDDSTNESDVELTLDLPEPTTSPEVPKKRLSETKKTILNWRNRK